MRDAVLWGATVLALGALALPITAVVLNRLPSLGYALSRPLALLLLGYGWWALGLTGVIPTGRATLFVVALAIAAASAVVVWRRGADVLSPLRDEWPVVVGTDVVTVLLFALWVWIVGHAPAIDHTEKPMDFLFLNSTLASPSFPPEDPWLSGFSVSYYYFGYLIAGALTRLTGLASGVTYNLALATVPALAGGAVFGLVYDLIRVRDPRRGTAVLYAGFAPVLLLLASNLEGVLEFARSQGWGNAGLWDWIGVKGLTGAPPEAPSLFPREGGWWWWRATRVIDTLKNGNSLDYTITEFPFFSFLLGDLHPHVTSMPFVFLALGLVFNLHLRAGGPSGAWLRTRTGEAFVLALSLGALGFLNTWDLPTISFVLAALTAARAWTQGGWGRLWRALAVVGAVVGLAVALYLPFYASFHNQATGVLPVSGVESRWVHLLIVWGLLGLLGASFLLRHLFDLRVAGARRSDVAVAVIVAALPFLVWLPVGLLLGWLKEDLAFAAGDAARRLLTVLPPAALVGLATFGLLRRARTGDHPGVEVALAMAGAGFLLIMGPELFRVVDFFGNRMNTVFKLHYQAWLLLAPVGAYGLYHWSAYGRRPLPRRLAPRVGDLGWTAVVALLIIASLYYPTGAAMQKTNSFRGPLELNGLAFTSRDGELAAIDWLRGQPRGGVAEAVGDDYSEFGRVAAATGYPSPLNWPGHELQWRGSSTPQEGRAEAVRRLYTATTAAEARGILDGYDIRYVVLGPRERRAYGAGNLDSMREVLEPRFSSGSFTIYERKP